MMKVMPIQLLEYQMDVQVVGLINLGQCSCPHKCTSDLDLGLIPVVTIIGNVGDDDDVSLSVAAEPLPPSAGSH